MNIQNFLKWLKNEVLPDHQALHQMAHLSLDLQNEMVDMLLFFQFHHKFQDQYLDAHEMDF